MYRNRWLSISVVIAIIIFADTAILAQNWLGVKSVIVHNGNPTDVYAQKVKPYEESVLIGLSKKSNVNHYCFTAWVAGNNFEVKGFLSTANITVSDFTILNDTVYFCGKRLTNQGYYIGVIGRFSLNAFIGGGNTYYEITDIGNTSNLIRLVAYHKPASNIVFVVAIGDYNTSTTLQARYVSLFYDSYNSSTVYQVQIPPQLYSTSNDIFQDICLTDNFVTTVSRNYPDNQFIVRTFELAAPEINQTSKFFAFSNLTFFSSFDPYEYPLHITALQGDTIALSVCAQDAANDLTMVCKLHALSDVISSSQIIHHADKDSKVLEMDYNPETNKLLLLTSSNFQNMGKKQTITLLNPDIMQAYTATTEMLSIACELNHLCATNNQYAIAGIYHTASNTCSHMLAVRDIPHQAANCVGYFPTNVWTQNTPQAINIPNIGVMTTYPALWIGDYLSIYISQWSLDCME